MPALYAHLRFGEDVLHYLPASISYFLEKYHEAFALGTQGPDILFYHQPLKRNELRAHGTFLHTLSGKEFFLAQAKKLTQRCQTDSVREIFEMNGAYAAYVCGFLCHFSLDVACHPFIDYNSCEALSHGKIESEFDKHVLRRNGRPIRGYNTATPITAENGVKEAVSKALDVPIENAETAIKTMKKINKLFSFPLEIVHSVCHVGLHVVGMERKFGDMFLHKKDDPLCEKANQILWDTYQNTLPTAANLIREYFENLKTFAATGQLHHPYLRYNFSGICR